MNVLKGNTIVSKTAPTQMVPLCVAVSLDTHCMPIDSPVQVSPYSTNFFPTIHALLALPGIFICIIVFAISLPKPEYNACTYA